MKVGLLFNLNNKLCLYSEKYREILTKNEIPFVLIDPNSESLLNDLKTCSHLLFRHTQGDTDMLIYDSIFNIAANIYRIKCFPDFLTYWCYENKVKEYYLLKSHGFPIIDTHVFWNYDHADRFLKKAKFPLIGKLPKGAGSSNVIMINSIKEGKKIINQVFNKGIKSHSMSNKSNLASLSKAGMDKYVRSVIKSLSTYLSLKDYKQEFPEWKLQKDNIIFQDYLPDNEFDIRVTVIGNRALAYRRFVRNNDFRASGSGNFNIDPAKIDMRCIEIAFSISKKLNFGTMAFDFIFDKNKLPLVSEISYSFTDWMVYSCPGYWDEKFTWHPGQNWPQYLQLSDFLERNDLERI